MVVGAQKCGTGSLHYYLGLHPEISMSRRKELNFFTEEGNWHRGIDWYRQWFDAASAVTGESSPNYSAFPRYSCVPERMASVIPETRLIYLVRDPIERIASHWVHNYAQRRELQDLRTTLLDPESSYVARSCYHVQFRRYLEYFDKSRILVVDSLDLRHKRLHTLRRIFEFLGVNADLYHPGFERLHHSSELKRRATPLGLRLRRMSRPWVRRGPAVTLWRAFEATLRLSHPIETHPNVADALGASVLARLREDAEEFRALTQLSLDHWSIFNLDPTTEG